MPVALSILIVGVVPPEEFIGVVAPTLVTVPPLLGELFVMVKLGYVPDIDMPVPAVKATVWSGAVFVIVNFAPEDATQSIPVLPTKSTVSPLPILIAEPDVSPSNFHPE